MLWVDVLNRSLDWQNTLATAQELATPPEGWSERFQAQSLRDVGLLRAAHATRSFGLSKSTSPALVVWIESLQLRVTAAELWRGFELPELRARRAAVELPRLADELLCTALVELLASVPGSEVVSRCHGLVRGGASPYSPADDAAFASTAGLQAMLDAGWSQCPRLVHAPRLGRYCSKSCSNASFVARKSAVQPRYFAAKQAHYRDRRRREVEPPRRESAFAFVD